jgi:hypothetical protein
VAGFKRLDAETLNSRSVVTVKPTWRLLQTSDFGSLKNDKGRAFGSDTRRWSEALADLPKTHNVSSRSSTMNLRAIQLFTTHKVDLWRRRKAGVNEQPDKDQGSARPSGDCE